MKVLNVRNVHQALVYGMDTLLENHEKSASRVGDVLVYPEPVATVYEKPLEMVVGHRWRDCNPFFHLNEAIWMLSGSNQVAPLTRFVKRMAQFSDDGETLNAAYGHRWRVVQGYDQIDSIVTNLRLNPTCRRQVLQTWVASIDHVVPFRGLVMNYIGKDAACNVATTFQISKGKLNAVNFCRSNDLFWGTYGSDAVCFAMLLWYVATAIGIEVGTLTQISVNYHAYADVMQRMKERRAYMDDEPDMYDNGVRPMATLFNGEADRERWDLACIAHVSGGHKVSHPFFDRTVKPLSDAYDSYRAGDVRTALNMVDQCEADDWRVACLDWMSRRNRGEE